MAIRGSGATGGSMQTGNTRWVLKALMTFVRVSFAGYCILASIVVARSAAAKRKASLAVQVYWQLHFAAIILQLVAFRIWATLMLGPTSRFLTSWLIAPSCSCRDVGWLGSMWRRIVGLSTYGVQSARRRLNELRTRWARPNFPATSDTPAGIAAPQHRATMTPSRIAIQVQGGSGAPSYFRAK